MRTFEIVRKERTWDTTFMGRNRCASVRAFALRAVKALNEMRMKGIRENAPSHRGTCPPTGFESRSADVKTEDWNTARTSAVRFGGKFGGKTEEKPKRIGLPKRGQHENHRHDARSG